MIYAKKIENPEGDYKDQKENTRWDFIYGNGVGGPKHKTPEELGYTKFSTKEEALEAWHLTYDPIPEPEPPYPDNN